MTEIEISKKLATLIDELADTAGTSLKLVEKIKNQAEKDGLTAKQLREVMEQAFEKRGLSDRQARRLMDADLKNENMVRSKPKLEKIADIMSANKPEQIIPDTRKYSEDSTPEPLDRDPTPEHPQPTDEPEESYHGDAGNNPELIEKYVPDEELRIFHADAEAVKSVFGHIFMANRNNIGAYFYTKGKSLYKILADNEYKLEVKSK